MHAHQEATSRIMNYDSVALPGLNAGALAEEVLAALKGGLELSWTHHSVHDVASYSSYHQRERSSFGSESQRVHSSWANDEYGHYHHPFEHYACAPARHGVQSHYDWRYHGFSRAAIDMGHYQATIQASFLDSYSHISRDGQNQTWWSFEFTLGERRLVLDQNSALSAELRQALEAHLLAPLRKQWEEKRWTTVQHHPFQTHGGNSLA